MTWQKLKIIYAKEMKDTLRDRRTLISMVLVPILLIPLLSVGIGGFVSRSIEKTKGEQSAIAIVGENPRGELFEKLQSDPRIRIVEVPDYRKALEEKQILVALGFPLHFEEQVNSSANIPSIEIFYDEAEMKSQIAMGKVREVLESYRKEIIARRVKTVGLREGFLTPFQVVPVNVASKEKMSGFIVGMFLPYMVIILSLTGSMYTAIDLTAGEKERGTLETLLVSPASRLELVLGKFGAVYTTGLVTAVLAMGSLTATMASSLFMPTEARQQMPFAIAPTSVLLVLLLMVPLVAIFASLLMTISIFAKSYKEAQSYISPLMIVAILPAMASILPGVELDAILAIVPVVNVSLFLKEALMGTLHWEFLGLVFLSTAAYAAMALFMAMRIFQRESVLFRV